MLHCQTSGRDATSGNRTDLFPAPQLPTFKSSSLLFALPVSCCPDGDGHGFNSQDRAKERHRHIPPARTQHRIPPLREPHRRSRAGTGQCTLAPLSKCSVQSGAGCVLLFGEHIEDTGSPRGQDSLGQSTPDPEAPPSVGVEGDRVGPRGSQASAVTVGWLVTSGEPEAGL